MLHCVISQTSKWPGTNFGHFLQQTGSSETVETKKPDKMHGWHATKFYEGYPVQSRYSIKGCDGIWALHC